MSTKQVTIYYYDQMNQKKKYIDVSKKRNIKIIKANLASQEIMLEKLKMELLENDTKMKEPVFLQDKNE